MGVFDYDRQRPRLRQSWANCDLIEFISVCPYAVTLKSRTIDCTAFINGRTVRVYIFFVSIFQFLLVNSWPLHAYLIDDRIL